MDRTSLESIDDLIRIPPFHSWLGVHAVDVGPGRAVLRIPPNDAFVGNPLIPAIHGGITAALIDLAGGAALFIDTQIPTPTIDMRVDYLRPAIAGRALVAEALVKRRGSTIAFVDVDVWQPPEGAAEGSAERGELVSTGRCTYSVKDAGMRGGPIG